MVGRVDDSAFCLRDDLYVLFGRIWVGRWVGGRIVGRGNIRCVGGQVVGG